MPKIGVGLLTVSQIEQRTAALTLLGDRGNFIITDDNKFLITNDNKRIIYGTDTDGSTTYYIITDSGQPLISDDNRYIIHSGATPPAPELDVITDNLFVKLDASNYTSGTWSDESGNSNNATVNGATWLSDNGGIFDFDGTNDTISISHTNNLSLNTSSQRTIQVWVKFDTLPAFNTQVPVFGKLSNNFGFDGYWGGLYSNSGVVRAVTNGTGIQKITDSVSPNLITTNTWYLFTFISQITNTAGSTKIYINETEFASAAHGTDSINETNPLYLGYIGTGVGSNYLNGKIGAMYFYTKGLTSGEVSTNYNNTKTRYV